MDRRIHKSQVLGEYIEGVGRLPIREPETQVWDSGEIKTMHYLHRVRVEVVTTDEILENSLYRIGFCFVSNISSPVFP